jgi:DNA-binding ferritin-like protein
MQKPSAKNLAAKKIKTLEEELRDAKDEIKELTDELEQVREDADHDLALARERADSKVEGLKEAYESALEMILSRH